MSSALMLSVIVASATGPAAPPIPVERALQLYERGGDKLPTLRARDYAALKNGHVVRRYTPPVKEGGAAGVLGMMIADVERDVLWVAVRDGHLTLTEGLTERRISGSYGTVKQVWFGLYELPMPFAARHWRIDTVTDVDLANKTNGRVWRSSWKRLDDGERANRRDAAAGKLAGISADTLEDAIYTRENRGSWALIDLDGRRTLLIYRATADVAGNIPHELVSTFARARLKALLKETVDQAAKVPAHYAVGHELILGGDGRYLPRHAP